MKKYVQNIDRLFAGQTANALILSQVDGDFPVLLPSLNPSDKNTVSDWLKKCKKVNPSFKLIDGRGMPIDANPTSRICDLDEDIFNKLNICVVDFNLVLQQKFKESGHQEMYMMDDTSRMKPNETTKSIQKRYMHCLNGKELLLERGGDAARRNTSQLNVLFPWKKTTNKSLYASQLKVYDESNNDEALESALGVTMQGKVSYKKCLQAVANIGDNLYMMSPDIDMEDNMPHRQFFANGRVVVNDYHTLKEHGIMDNSLTLFQPGKSRYDDENLAKDANGLTQFIEWYRTHNRRTILEVVDAYGTNLTTLKYLGKCSYEMTVATYGPTDIYLYGDGETTDVRLNSETYRAIRAGNSKVGQYNKGRYIIGKTGDAQSTGFMFNLYDNFVSGQDRKIRMTIPMDKDFNKLTFQFEWEIQLEQGFLGDVEVVLQVGETKFVDDVFNAQTDKDRLHGSVEIPIWDASLTRHNMEIATRMHYEVDYNKRSQQMQYVDMLSKSGVILKDIRVQGGLQQSDDLTFGQYVNEDGIPDDERNERYGQFWKVSRYWKDISYQIVLESPLKNVASSGIQYPNNYSTGDTYGDIFLTKSVLDPNYNMNIHPRKLDKEKWAWVDDDGKDGEWVLRMIGRQYINLLQCSEQLTLVYNPIDMIIYDDNVVSVEPLPEGDEDSSASSLSSLDSDKSTDTILDVMHETVQEDSDEKGDSGKSGGRYANYGDLKYQMVETVKSVNKFESSIKHKPNVFSVIVEHSNLPQDNSGESNEALERYKSQLRNSVTQFVRNACKDVAPIHTQLFDVQFI